MIKYARDGTVYDVYPLTRAKKTVGENVVYDRDARGKAYFYLRLVLPPKQFITSEGSAFICSDGTYFKTL